MMKFTIRLRTYPLATMKQYLFLYLILPFHLHMFTELRSQIRGTIYVPFFSSIRVKHAEVPVWTAVKIAVINKLK